MSTGAKKPSARQLIKMKKAARWLVNNPEVQPTDKLICNLLFGVDTIQDEVIIEESVTKIMADFDSNYVKRYEDFSNGVKLKEQEKDEHNCPKGNILVTIERLNFDNLTGDKLSKPRSQYFNEKAWKQWLKTHSGLGWTVVKVLANPSKFEVPTKK